MTFSTNTNVLLLYVAEQDEINLGVGFLSAALKEKGWETSCLVWHIRPGILETPLDQILNNIKNSDPACICISALSLHYPFIIKLLDRIREAFNGPVVIGGYHAIAFPESFWRHPAADVICIGDGEEPLLNFLQACRTSRDAYGIKGLWGKKGSYFSSDWQGDHWYVSNLEDYAYMDYALFDNTKPLSERTNFFISPTRQTLTIMPAVSGRGCPYKCTYCSNALRMNNFPSVKAYLRKYSPEFLIQNLKKAVDRFNVQFIDFLDELFIYDKKWLMEFAALYKEQIRLPFSAQVHLGFITKEICMILKDCGWILAAFGVECGDEQYRRDHLNRSTSNEMILKNTGMLKQAGIYTVAYNMIGMPLETVDTMRATLELNKKLLPDLGMLFHWQPLPGTELTKLAKKIGLFTENDNLVTNYGDSSIHSELRHEMELCHSEFLAEKFSMANDGPDHLMEKLTQFTLDWIDTKKPSKYDC